MKSGSGGVSKDAKLPSMGTHHLPRGRREQSDATFSLFVVDIEAHACDDSCTTCKALGKVSKGNPSVL